MTLRFKISERAYLATQIAPYMPLRGEPTTRPLWIYSSDPANVGLWQPVLRLDTPYEPLRPGPVGKLFAVQHEPMPEALRALLDWSEKQAAAFANNPLELDSFRHAMSGGLQPTTGDPRFAGQMVYAVCQQIYEVFRKALGRNPVWGPWALERIESPQLRIRPYAFNDANAFYDSEKGTLEFGYFPADPTDSELILPGGLVLAALSRDIIAHELTHAILDGMRAEFMRDTHLDVGAFHEAFADLIALFHHFMQPTVLEQAISESGGDVNADLLLDLGRQFGEGINGPGGGALRRALERDEKPDEKITEKGRYFGDKPREAHDRGSILVAAVFEAYLRVYRKRSQKILRLAHARAANELPPEAVQLLAESAQSLAGHFLKICIRAIDYCPPVDLRFGAYLRALVTADMDATPNDPLGYRDAFIKAFRRRNIEIDHVSDLSEGSLRWRAPELEDAFIPALAFSRLRFTDNGLNQPRRPEVERRANALGEYIIGDPSRLRHFGLHEPGAPYEAIVIQSIRFAHRTSADDLPRHELVAEVTQERRERGNTFVGGATVIVGMDGEIRYIIRRRVDHVRLRRAEMRHAGPGGAAKLNFRAIHARRSKN